MAAKKKVGGKSCWRGYRADGTKVGKNGKRVNNCVPVKKGSSKKKK
mgnify:CR=1 FL=1|tara:strand:- start:339 stop:476 length:138 start_codon:yes stop_codon:yes gene_type:complete